jgi:large subunit ribosomal protein L18
MITKRSKNDTRKARQRRVRKKVSGTPSRPRLNVYRSLKNIYAQIIDDTTGTTLVSASSLDKEIVEKVSGTGNKEAARLVGKMIGEKAQAKGIESLYLIVQAIFIMVELRKLATVPENPA